MPAPGLEALPGNPRFPLFDALRGLAALAVVLYHWGALARPSGVLGDLVSHGNAGVVVFFAVSGFLLYRPFLMAREGRAPPVRTGRLYARRALRVVPGYWAALILLAAFGLISLGDRPWQLFAFAQIYSPNMTFAGIGPAWSLCIEVSFYLALPLWAALMARLTRGRAGGAAAAIEFGALAAASGGSLLLHVVWSTDGDGYLGFTLPASFYLFAVGMGLAVADVLVPELVGRVLGLRRATLFLWSLAAGCFVAIAATTDASALGSLHPIYAIVAVLLVASAMGRAAPPANVVVRALAALGVISYSLYLWHQPLLVEMSSQGARGLLLLIGGLAATIVVSVAMWFAVERPALTLKRRRVQ